jgi:hypothetical protein
MGRLGESDRLGFILAGLRESPELGKSPHEPHAVIDRWRRAEPKVLIDTVGGQHRQVGGGQLHDLVVLPAKVMRLLEM